MDKESVRNSGRCNTWDQDCTGGANKEDRAENGGVLKKGEGEARHEPCDLTSEKGDGKERGQKRKVAEDGDVSPKRFKSQTTTQQVAKESEASPDHRAAKNSSGEGNGGIRKDDTKLTDGDKKSPRAKTTVDPKAEFDEKYTEAVRLTKGSYGYVFAGYRRADNFPVAIKHIPKRNVTLRHVDEKGKKTPMELAIMLHLRNSSSDSVGASAAVSLLDWYNLPRELLLVMERPVPCEDLYDYINNRGGALQEGEAKVIMKQLVDAVTDLLDNGVFHRDIKIDNILIETRSGSPRVRLIDFGLSCFHESGRLYDKYYGAIIYKPLECYGFCSYSPGPFTVWHLGAVLYEMLHRVYCFDAFSFLEGAMQVSTELSMDCQDFIYMCLAGNPDERMSLEELKNHPWLTQQNLHPFNHQPLILPYFNGVPNQLLNQPCLAQQNLHAFIYQPLISTYFIGVPNQLVNQPCLAQQNQHPICHQILFHPYFNGIPNQPVNQPFLLQQNQHLVNHQMLVQPYFNCIPNQPVNQPCLAQQNQHPINHQMLVQPYFNCIPNQPVNQPCLAQQNQHIFNHQMLVQPYFDGVPNQPVNQPCLAQQNQHLVNHQMLIQPYFDGVPNQPVNLQCLTQQNQHPVNHQMLVQPYFNGVPNQPVNQPRLSQQHVQSPTSHKLMVEE